MCTTACVPWIHSSGNVLSFVPDMSAAKGAGSKIDTDSTEAEGKVVAKDYQGPYLALAYYVIFLCDYSTLSQGPMSYWLVLLVLVRVQREYPFVSH
jgi:hypothetical protein